LRRVGAIGAAPRRQGGISHYPKANAVAATGILLA
jgi:hypothetical protein